MTTSETALSVLFLEFSRKKLLDLYWPRLRTAIEALTDEQIWWRPNPASNSIGNLLLHLNGNVTQWLVASFNRLEDRRDRPAEFRENEKLPGKILLERLGATIEQAAKTLARLTPDDLAASYHIQGTQPQASPRCTKSLSISDCTTDRFSTSTRCCAAKIWDFIAS